MKTSWNMVTSSVASLPFAVAAALSAAFYSYVFLATREHSLIRRYSTEHAVEFVIVGFFIWGLTDIAFHAVALLREKRATRRPMLPPRGGREPIAAAAALYQQLIDQPQWLQNSRMGQRLSQALTFLVDKGSAEGLDDYLLSLAEHDDDRTFSNYGLVRFIAWVTPVLGFLGTVFYFGTALSGLTVDEMADNLPIVVTQMGAAFDTTTIALAASATMMFALFLCERTEKELIRTIDRRVERELLHRFTTTSASLAPYLDALKSAHESTLQTMEATTQKQLQVWSQALRVMHQEAKDQNVRTTETWHEAMTRLERQFHEFDLGREKRFVALLDAVALFQKEHREHLDKSIRDVTSLRDDFQRIATTLAAIVGEQGNLNKLQSSLATNLQLLHQTQKMEDVFHGLSAAVHLLTARTQASRTDDQSRAA